MAKRWLGLISAMVLALAFAGCNSSGGYGISGTVIYNYSGLEDVIMTLSNGDTVTTDSEGNYSFSDLSNGTYTITPSLSGYSFDPTSLTVVVDGSTATADFVATSSDTGTYTISGNVTYGGSGLEYVTMQLSGSASKTVQTDSSGNYSFTSLSDGTYTVTPLYTGYTFSPTSLTETINGGAVTGVELHGFLVSIKFVWR